MSEASDLAFAGAARQAELLAAREVGSRELTELYLERIERIDPRLNSFVRVLADEALAAADRADERLGAGESAPLLGVPVAVKDSSDIAGVASRQGSRAFPDPVAADSDDVRRLRGAGAVVIGKTAMPELAITGFTEPEAFGPSRNPWDPSRTCGGSSGGSGAAVAAGLVAIAGSADGAGSTRIPAACNGLFGLKPQAGRVPLEPADHWSGMSVGGCVSRTVADSALFLDVVAVAPPDGAESFRAAAEREPGTLRIAVTDSAPRTLVKAIETAEVRRAVADTEALLGSLGHRTHREDPDWGRAGINLSTRYLGGIRTDVEAVERRDELEARTRGFARIGLTAPDPLVRRAVADSARDRERIGRIFDRADVLLCPTVGEPPVEVGRWAGRSALRTLLGMSRTYGHTPVWNHTGQPAAAVPAGFTAEGLPLSIQIVGRPGDEATLLSLARQIELARPWAGERPALAA